MGMTGDASIRARRIPAEFKDLDQGLRRSNTSNTSYRQTQWMTRRPCVRSLALRTAGALTLDGLHHMPNVTSVHSTSSHGTRVWMEVYISQGRCSAMFPLAETDRVALTYRLYLSWFWDVLSSLSLDTPARSVTFACHHQTGGSRRTACMTCT